MIDRSAGGATPQHSFFVHGVPEQQGSTRAFVVNGKPVITTTNKNLESWRRLIRDQAQIHSQMHTQGVKVRATFVMPKPKSASKKVVSMTKRPDLDKLIRALLDALTGVFFKDDSQVCHIDAIKVYGQSDERIGVLVEVWAEPEPPRRTARADTVPTHEYF